MSRSWRNNTESKLVVQCGSVSWARKAYLGKILLVTANGLWVCERAQKPRSDREVPMVEDNDHVP
jgi:hypothetical protein